MAHGGADEPVGKVEEKRPKAPVGSRRIFPPQFKLQVISFIFIIFVITLQRYYYFARSTVWPLLLPTTADLVRSISPDFTRSRHRRRHPGAVPKRNKNTTRWLCDGRHYRPARFLRHRPQIRLVPSARDSSSHFIYHCRAIRNHTRPLDCLA